MDKQLFFQLLDKYAAGTATAGEQLLVEAYYRRLEETGHMELSEEEEMRVKEVVYKKIMAGIGTDAIVTPLHSNSWNRIAVAASILLVIGLGSYFAFFNKPSKQNEMANKPAIQDLMPGTEGAVLTLADGRTIVLDSVGNGKVSASAIKNGSQLSYVSNDNTRSEYNTMSTAKGRQYSLELADGSKVWLNAASSITFPTVFNGKERKVEITGEAYFEVQHDATKPFIVTVNGMNVQVLGTHFNINSYTDESAITTTLLEGSVRVTKQGKEVVIMPGQQAALKTDGVLSVNQHANMEEAMAWRKGRFTFINADLKTIMRQVARWYDVAVVFEGHVPDVVFSGEIGRQLTLLQLLSVLDETRIHYKLEGKILTLLP